VKKQRKPSLKKIVEEEEFSSDEEDGKDQENVDNPTKSIEETYDESGNKYLFIYSLKLFFLFSDDDIFQYPHFEQ
jgi:hypothetical protein